MVLFVLTVLPILWSGLVAGQGEWETPLGRRFDVETDQEIAALQSQLQPGDYMVMRPGIWQEARIFLNASGSAEPGRKIYLFSDSPGATRLTNQVQIIFSGSYQEIRGIHIDGIAADRTTPVWFEQWSSNCRFTDSVITAYNRANPDLYDHHLHHWVEAFGSYHTIDYNAFEGKEGMGQLVRVKTINGEFLPPGAQPYSWGHSISHNFFGPREETEDDNGEGIQIGLRESEFVDTDTIMEFNLFEDYDAELECISVKGSNNVMRHNTVRNSACTLTFRHCDNTTAHDNYVFGGDKNATGGFRVAGVGNRIFNNYVENQAFTGQARGGIVLWTASENPTRRQIVDLEIFRNVIISNDRALVVGFEPMESLGGTGYPLGTVYRENVMTGKDASSVILTDINQIDPVFEGNVFFDGIIENLDDYADGIDVRDPELVYDEEWGIYRPTNAGWDFEMAYLPLTRDDPRVGPTWEYNW